MPNKVTFLNVGFLPGVTVGVPHTFRVVALNSGDTTWTRAAGFRLALPPQEPVPMPPAVQHPWNPANWQATGTLALNANRWELPVESVAPGESAIWEAIQITPVSADAFKSFLRLSMVQISYTGIVFAISI